MQAFKVKKDGKVLDYRRAEPLNLDTVRKYFSKKFDVVDVRQPGRHVIIAVEKNAYEYIIKLASTEGIGARTETEKVWNEEFNKHSKSKDFRVPNNLDDGYYNGLYYLIVEKFEGDHLSTLRGGNNSIGNHIDGVVAFSEYIQTLPLTIPNNDLIATNSHQEWFVEKTKSWLENIGLKTIQKYNIDQVFELVRKGALDLLEKPRHGDFTPWHLIALDGGGLGLIDGEHAHSHGVEYYDIAYFIQRVFSVIDRRDLAEQVLENIKTKKFDMDKLKIVLLSRAIGGFCDEYLSPVPNYEKAQEFSDFVAEL